MAMFNWAVESLTQKSSIITLFQGDSDIWWVYTDDDDKTQLSKTENRLKNIISI